MARIIPVNGCLNCDPGLKPGSPMNDGSIEYLVKSRIYNSTFLPLEMLGLDSAPYLNACCLRCKAVHDIQQILHIEHRWESSGIVVIMQLILEPLKPAPAMIEYKPRIEELEEPVI